MRELLLLCLLYLLRDMFSYVSTPTPLSIVRTKERFGYMITSTSVSIVCVKERFGYMIIPAHVAVITIEGEDWILDDS